MMDSPPPPYPGSPDPPEGRRDDPEWLLPEPNTFQAFLSREWLFLLCAAFVLLFMLAAQLVPADQQPQSPVEMSPRERKEARKTFKEMFDRDPPPAANALAGAILLGVILCVVVVAVRIARHVQASDQSERPEPAFERPPDAVANWGLWDALKLAFVYILLFGLANSIRDVGHEFGLVNPLVAGSGINAFLATHSLVSLLTVYVAFWIIRTRGQDPHRALGLGWNGFGSQLAAGVVLFGASIPIFVAVSRGWTELLQRLPGKDLSAPQDMVVRFATTGSLAEAVQIFAAAGLVAPVMEEVFFRGMLYGAVRGRVRRWLAITFASVCFGAVHMPALSAAVPMCFLGGVLCYVYERTGRIGVPILLHALYNVVQLSLILSYRTSWEGFV
jgi:hypothetical protein